MRFAKLTLAGGSSPLSCASSARSTWRKGSWLFAPDISSQAAASASVASISLLPWTPLDLAESADSSEQSGELPQSGAAAPTDGDRFLREGQSLLVIAEPVVRRRHRREHP